MRPVACMHGFEVVLMHAAAAKSFAQQRMFGAGKKRSAEMLVPTGRGVKAQGRPSAYRGPALKFV